MKQKTYRTAQGRVVDLGAMIAQNETVRAVGNMNVNARGDIIDNQGRVLSTRGEQVNRNLNRQTNSGSVPSGNRAPKQSRPAKLSETEQLELDRTQREAKRQAMERGETVKLKGDAPTQGLAAAMARAEQLKDQE